ncbi:MAG: DUF72 domain-containing protein [Pseudomonadales bacterium]
MDWYAGTSGFSYKPWKGSFYPADLPDGDMLGYYAERLPAVEINNTFYRMPRSNVLESWAAAVPESFRFVIKASRRITHQLRLKDAAEPTAYLLAKLNVLGDKLGAVLFQLPPNLRCDPARLETFLDLLPPQTPAAFEFRHPSWNDPQIHDLLRGAGAALCVAEADDDADTTEPELTVTAPWLYLRLRRAHYPPAAVRRWRARGEASGAERGFVFFKHEDAGAGPALAQRFLELGAPRTAKAPRAGPKKPPAATRKPVRRA